MTLMNSPAGGGRRARRRIRLLLVWVAVTGIAFTGARAVRKALNEAHALARWAAVEPDSVTRFEQGLGRARALLSRERIVGYASVAPNEKLMTLGYEQQTHRFILAQYALAPLVVSRSVDRRWVFADFPTAVALREFAARKGYAIRWNQEGRGVLEAAPR